MIWVLHVGVGTAAPPVCAQGWCWEQRGQIHADLLDVLAGSDREALVLTGGGTLMSWRKGRWKVVDAPTGAQKLAGTYEEPWILGAQGLLARRVGSSWERIETGTQAAITDLVVKDGRLLASGSYGFSKAEEGKQGQGVLLTGPPQGPLEALEVARQVNTLAELADGVLGLGRLTYQASWDGERWNAPGEKDPWPRDLPVEAWMTHPTYQASWVDGAGGVWTTAWSSLDDAAHVWRRDPQRGWAPYVVHGDHPVHDVGPGPTLAGSGPLQLAVLQDHRFQPVDLGLGEVHLRAVDGFGDGVLVVGDRGSLVRRSGESWEVLQQPSPKVDDQALWARRGEVVYREGQLVTDAGVTLEDLPQGMLQDFWAPSADIVFLATLRGLHRWEGGTWTEIRAQHDRDIRPIGGTSANDVWFVSQGRQLWHWDGQAAARIDYDEAVRGKDFFRTLAAGPGEVWLAGDTSVFRYAQGTLERIEVPFGVRPLAIQLQPRSVRLITEQGVLVRKRR